MPFIGTTVKNSQRRQDLSKSGLRRTRDEFGSIDTDLAATAGNFPDPSVKLHTLKRVLLRT